MRFYINLLSTYYPGLDAPYAEYYRQVLEQVELAEELGWECFMFNEHHFLRYGGLIADPAILLAAAASRTSRIRLGPCISIITLRHPLQIAEQYAMVDAISGGRLEFGIGSGNTDLDYRVFGIPRDESQSRLDEATGVIVKAWTHDRFSHRGKFWNFEEITLYPRPRQQPHPPIWVAGTSPATLGWAGRHGYDIMTVAHPHPPEAVKLGVDAWREALTAAGHDAASRRCQLHLRVYVDENTERARDVAMAAIARYDEVATIGRKSASQVNLQGKAYNWEGMLASGRNCYGNPEQCIGIINNTIRNYQFDTLTTTFNFGGIPYEKILRSMRLFAKEVMPAFL